MSERRDTKNRILLKGEYQKDDGRYMYKYVDLEGKNRFVYSWTLTQTDRPPKGKYSGKCLRELEKEIAQDLNDKINSFGARKLTINSFYEEYIKQNQGLKPSTRINYNFAYQKHIYNSIGKKKISEVKYSDVKKFYEHLIYNAGLKFSSTKVIQNLLHQIFCIAVRDGYVRTNPTIGVLSDIKNGCDWQSPKRHALTVGEQEAFIEFVKSNNRYQRFLPLFTFLLGTGCRIGEAAGLTWNDCDFKNEIIHINHSLSYRADEQTGKYKLFISVTKTSAGTREIPMLEEVKQMLLSEFSKQKQEGCPTASVDGYSNFVFLKSKNSTVFLTANVDRVIKLIVKEYNAVELKLAKEQNRDAITLPYFSVHNLRHTFCTRLCEHESNLKVVQEVMGHSNISTTMNIYNEATIDAKKSSFKALQGKIKIS